MIVEKESEVKILRSFYEDLFSYFSIADISKKTKISRNWVYKIIYKFEKIGILEKFGKKYKLNFSNLFCKKLKLLFDSEFLVSLDKKLRDRLFNVTNKIIFEIKPESVILVGSIALNKQKEKSDIDLLVISENKKIPHIENCNIITLNDKEFKEKYLKGDDFVIFALSFGKIVFDKECFIRFLENPLPIFSQEVIQEKIKYCEKLEERIYTLLKIDEEKAKEELLFLVLQVARIILLENKVVPKTKYDIAEQVKVFDQKLSEIIRQLLKKNKISKEKMLNYVKVCNEKIRQ